MDIILWLNTDKREKVNLLKYGLYKQINFSDLIIHKKAYNSLEKTSQMLISQLSLALY
jgi:hypothetical protein